MGMTHIIPCPRAGGNGDALCTCLHDTTLDEVRHWADVFRPTGVTLFEIVVSGHCVTLTPGSDVMIDGVPTELLTPDPLTPEAAYELAHRIVEDRLS